MTRLLPIRWNLFVILLAVATMVGCQGLSSSNKTSTAPPNTPKPGQLAVAPTSISFGVVKVGNNQSLPATMTNSGGSSLQVTQATATGAGFSVSGLSFPVTLTPGQSQGFTVVFTPQSAGTIKGNLAVANTGSTPTLNVALSGGSQTAGTLSPSPASLDFGSVQVGGNQTLPETLTNSGGSTVTVTQVNPTGTGFSVSGLSLPLVLAAGQNQPFNVTFTPSSSGSSSGNLAIVSDASNSSLNVALSGNGLAPGALTAGPSSLSFGNVQVGNNLQLSETLTNSGGVNVHISQASITGTGFSMSGLAPPLLLTPGQRFTFNVTFTPPSTGNDTGNIAIVSDASNPNLAIPLSGTGTPVPQGQLAITPTTMSFGSVFVGTNAQLNGTLTASGATVIVSSDQLNGSAFAISGLPSFPITIPAGQQVQFTVTFTPSATGVASGSISFASNASNSPTIESLTGTGAPPPTHTVSLSWTASTSQNIIGYNIYRGGTSGGPYSKINSVLDPSTLYTDSAVVDGKTYYYVTSAVNSSNQESGYSNQTTAVIPPP
ncbi:MAG TPA: choice-of-anchor D domain-containing protein [Terriglobales bacterium]|nr:choice-of-anchor D domain-containing protein [Terriglobales bacterium]